MESSALMPVATLSSPVVFEYSASVPVATLSVPVVFEASALKPVATLSPPVVLADSASVPVATLLLPVVLENSAAAGGDVRLPACSLQRAGRRRCCGAVVRLGITERPRPTLPTPVKVPLKRVSPAAALLLASK